MLLATIEANRKVLDYLLYGDQKSPEQEEAPKPKRGPGRPKKAEAAKKKAA